MERWARGSGGHGFGARLPQQRTVKQHRSLHLSEPRCSQAQNGATMNKHRVGVPEDSGGPGQGLAHRRCSAKMLITVFRPSALWGRWEGFPSSGHFMIMGTEEGGGFSTRGGVCMSVQHTYV